MPDVRHFDPDVVLDEAMRLLWRQGEAVTGIQDIVAVTGINRSSLYATFGSKQGLYQAALRRYLQRQSQPVFDRLADGERGLDGIAEFFSGLIRARCQGPYARWGCMVANAHAAGDSGDAEIGRLLDRHHDQLRAALRVALNCARNRGQLRTGLDVEATADLLALVAYGVNLRSRAGADPDTLQTSADTALQAISR
jgi:AcrR family transcriptional regulator